MTHCMDFLFLAANKADQQVVSREVILQGMKKYAIINFKGGVGKTSVAVNLAAALAQLGRKVLLIDTDMQCNATDTFNAEYDYTLYDVFYGQKKLNEVIVNVRENIDLVPSDPKMQYAANYLVTMHARERILAKALRSLPEDRYDYVLIDNNPAFTIITQNSVFAADELIIPVEMQHYSIEGIVKMMDELYEFYEAFERQMKIAMVIPMKLDRRFSTTEHYLDSLKRFFGDRLSPPIRTDTSVAKAQGFRQTILEYDPKCKASEDFFYLAQILDQEAVENDP